jgi:hypothetical protein
LSFLWPRRRTTSIALKSFLSSERFFSNSRLLGSQHDGLYITPSGKCSPCNCLEMRSARLQTFSIRPNVFERIVPTCGFLRASRRHSLYSLRTSRCSPDSLILFKYPASNSGGGYLVKIEKQCEKEERARQRHDWLSI